jgi:hypothetical protein
VNQSEGFFIRVFFRSCAQIEEREERGENIEERRKHRACQIDTLSFAIMRPSILYWEQQSNRMEARNKMSEEGGCST